MSNAPWSGSVDQLRSDLGLDHVELINDFEALALSLPFLGGPDLRPIGGPGSPVAGAPLLVLGPGTGLGTSVLLPTGSTWLPIPCEGGHVDISVVTDLEVEVMRLLRAEHGSGSAELLLSGAGLARLHRLLALVHGVRTPPLTPADICTCFREDPLCAETLQVFCALLGSFAGNAALTTGARGGVYLGGGILPRIADVLEASTFRQRFEAKPPVQDYLRAIPTSLIVAPTPALAGAAARLHMEYA